MGKDVESTHFSTVLGTVQSLVQSLLQCQDVLYQL